jgi:hypothetical protein
MSNYKLNEVWPVFAEFIRVRQEFEAVVTNFRMLESTIIAAHKAVYG